jgi:4-amino-4-deoxy-L-arabinose transferase-like glycosyltransferase
MGVSLFFRKNATAVNKAPPGCTPPAAPDPRRAASEQSVVEAIEIGGGNSPAARPRWPPRWRAGVADLKTAAATAGLWLLLCLASLSARALWPQEETRLVTVAWEMWIRDGFVLPTINGEPYTRQAPLMAWLIAAGWGLFGVNDWWPRLLPALCSLASLAVVLRLARLLWREDREAAQLAPRVLLGMPLWALYTTLALPDMLAAFFTLLGWWAVLIQWRHRDMRAFLLLGAALGFGALALGTIIYVYVLPVAVLAPLWCRGAVRMIWKYWYGDIAKAVMLGVVVLGLWLLLAARAAGGTYVMEWLSGSLTGARLELFTTGQSWWWYLAWLPIVTLPWSIWPLLWRRLWHIRREPLNAGLAFCAIGSLSTLALLSLIDGKQPQFLLPLLPLVALPLSWLLAQESLAGAGDPHPLLGMTLPVVVLGAVLAVLPQLPRIEVLPELLWELSPGVGLGVMVVGIALAWLPLREVRRRALEMAAAGVLLVVFLILGAGSLVGTFYPTDEVGRFLAAAQARHRPIAWVGEYQGTFQFAGRLREPLAVIEPAQAQQWISQHPDGLLIAEISVWQPPPADRRQPLLELPYGNSRLRAWDATLAPLLRQPSGQRRATPS